MNEILGLVLGFILAIGNGLFVASEFSLVNLNRGDLEGRKERGEEGLNPVINALKITSTHLSSAQLGITITTLLTGYTFQPAVSSLVQEPMRAMGLNEATVTGTGAIIGVALATGISMVVGELIPKNFALSLPLATAKAVVPFQTVFTKALYPIIRMFNDTANAIIRRFGIEPKEELSAARTAEELSSLVRHSALVGDLELDLAVRLQRSLSFPTRKAVEVMTPRTQVEFVESTAPASEVLELTRRTGHSRFPVFEGSRDNVIGLVHLKHAFALPSEEWETTPVSRLTSDVTFVPESVGVDDLLHQLRTHGHHFAIVLDEYGGTAGIATLEDLSEELVGEVADEHDKNEERITRLEDRLILDAQLRPDELESLTGLEVPDSGGYETLAGFMASALGRVPEQGDMVELETGNLRVKSVDRTVVNDLEYISHEPENDPAMATLEERVNRLREEENSDE